MQTDGRWPERRACQGATHHGRLYAKCEIVGYVELRQRRVYVCIDDGKGVNAQQAEETKVAPTAIAVFTTFEDALVLLLVLVGYSCAQVQKLVVALCCWVGVHDVLVGL